MSSALIPTTKYNERYHDISLTFKPNPMTGDLMSRDDIDAVKDSIRNIILTNKSDRPFQPGFGADVYRLFFQKMLPTTVESAKMSILQQLTAYEPRIKVLSIDVSSPQSQVIVISVMFKLIGTQEIASVEISVERTA